MATERQVAAPVRVALPLQPPAPSTVAPRGGPAAVKLSSTRDASGTLALAFANALLSDDAEQARSHLAQPVLRLRSGRYVAREDAVERCLSLLRGRQLAPGTQLESLVDVARLQVTAERGRRRVTLPTQPDVAPLPCVHALLVEPGARPRIVGIDD